MSAAVIMVRAFTGQIFQPLNAPCGIKHQLSRAAIHVFTAEPQDIGVFIIVNGQLPAKNLARPLVPDLYSDLAGGNLKKFLFNNSNTPLCIFL